MRLVILAVVLGLVAWLLTFLPIPDPFRSIIWVILVLVLIWEILAMAGYTRSPFSRRQQ